MLCSRYALSPARTSENPPVDAMALVATSWSSPLKPDSVTLTNVVLPGWGVKRHSTCVVEP